MTNEEAIKYFELAIKPSNEITEEEFKKLFIGTPDAQRCAIKALEKQIPRKIPPVNGVYYCLNCGSEVEECHVDGIYDFCPYCGQAIDWGDAE